MGVIKGHCMVVGIIEFEASFMQIDVLQCMIHEYNWFRIAVAL